MPLHLIVVDKAEDFAWHGPDRRVLTADEYATEPPQRLPVSARVINLCRDYSYLSLGYYCSLQAEARGQKVIPSVEVMLDLHWKRLLRIALPEVNVLVARTFVTDPAAQPALTTHVFFGVADDPRLAVAARRIFELFRCPMLALDIKHGSGWEIAAIRPMSIRDLKPEQRPLFEDALDKYTRSAWRAQKESAPARYSLAILHDPDEKLPPSNPVALAKFVKAGASLGVEVELITRKDYGRLTAFDALFIRETTALDHHTYRFAKKAEAEDIPVIDDPRSILKCTNKIYLAETLQANRVPGLKSLIVDAKRLERVEEVLGYPAVLKVPDGSFSRGVFKVASRGELNEVAQRAFKESDLVIAQQFVETPFDWRIGVLAGKPLFVCQYFMARGHWQIIKHDGNQRFIEGASRTFAVDDAPPLVVETALKATALIGDGLYGVDLKETADGVFVVEVNDNPNIDAGVEDAVAKDALYTTIIEEFLRRLERRTAPRGQSSARGPADLPSPTAEGQPSPVS